MLKLAISVLQQVIVDVEINKPRCCGMSSRWISVFMPHKVFFMML
jgi:hypothetical protein